MFSFNHIYFQLLLIYYLKQIFYSYHYTWHEINYHSQQCTKCSYTTVKQNMKQKLYNDFIVQNANINQINYLNKKYNTKQYTIVKNNTEQFHTQTIKYIINKL